MKANDLKGKPVIEVGEAERLGQVDDIALNLEQQKVAGVLLGSGGLFGSKPDRFIPSEVIHGIGADAVTVRMGPGTAVPERPDGGEEPERQEALPWPRLSHLQGARVVSESGNLLGEVQELEFNPDTLRLEGFYISPKGGGWRAADRLMPADAVMSHGEQLLVVREDTAARMDLGETPSMEETPSEEEQRAFYEEPRAG